MQWSLLPVEFQIMNLLLQISAQAHNRIISCWCSVQFNIKDTQIILKYPARVTHSLRLLKEELSHKNKINNFVSTAMK